MSTALPTTPARAQGLLSPIEVADWLSVTPAWVYAHAAEMGAKRLGAGPKARLRFGREDVEAYLNACSLSRESAKPETSATTRNRPRRKAGSLGTNVQLLPIRGRSVAENEARTSRPVPSKRAKRQFDQRVQDAFCELIAAGMSCAAATRELGFSRDTPYAVA
jgi:hypothetical protein